MTGRAEQLAAAAVPPGALMPYPTSSGVASHSLPRNMPRQ
jgi:hypothetical protein